MYSDFCGSWLACDGGGTFNITLTDPPLSRASPLPQDLCRTQILYIPAPPVGASLLAMLLILLLLWLLILICCPFPRGRTQALRRGHRGKDAAVAAPGHGWPMAAGPPEQCLRYGMPSLGEAPNGGAKPFWFLFGVWKKGLAVKAKPPVGVTAETDMYTIKIPVGYQAAIAGKPAPTI